MLKNHDELAAEKLRRVCEPSIFDFRSTAELSTLTEIIGQERAVRATTFGMDIESPGYHIFALGLPGTGKTTMIKDLLRRKSVNQPVPDDWCYINNFENGDQPRALRLPAGRGAKLQSDMNHFQ